MQNKKILYELWGFGGIGKLIPRVSYEILDKIPHVYQGNLPTLSKVITTSGTPHTITRDFNTDSDYQFHRWNPKIYATDESYNHEKKLARINDPSRMQVFSISTENLFEREENDTSIIVNSTGLKVLKKRLPYDKFLKGSVKKIIVTCPPADESIPEIIIGVNDHLINYEEEQVFSVGSCSGNCSIPILDRIHNIFGIQSGFIDVPHAETASNEVVDKNNINSPERGRSIIANTIFTTTGCINTIFKVLPSLKGKIFPFPKSIRNPVLGSAVSFRLTLEKEISKNDFIKTFEMSKLYTDGIIGIIDNETLTPKDVLGRSQSGIIVPHLIKIEGKMISFEAFFDNRYGYSTRVAELLLKLTNYV